MNTPLPLRIGLTAAALHMFITALAPAQIIGYWRFESEANPGLDSGTNGYNLTVQGVPSYLTNIGAFPSVIPQTGQTNIAAVSTTAATNFFHIADQADFYQTSFTVEAFVRPTSSNFFGHIASIAGGSQNQWRMGLNTGGNTFAFGLSDNGSTFTTFNWSNGSANSLVGKDIYLGVTVDINSGSGTVVEWYFQNLTDAQPLQTFSITNASFTNLFNSTNAFNILSQNTNTNNAWRGRVDEVRYSAGVLSEAQLLAVPEASSLTLALGGLAALALLGLRRRGAPNPE